MVCLWNAASTNREDGSDILAIFPSGLVVADVSVAHPAATSYSCAAARTAGAAAASRDALKRRQYHAGGLLAALYFYPLSVEPFGCFGVSAMQFLNARAEAALVLMLSRWLSSLGRFESLALLYVWGMSLYIGRLCMSMLPLEALTRVWVFMCQLLTSCSHTLFVMLFCFRFARIMHLNPPIYNAFLLKLCLYHAC
jgi:hypothetical protein